MVRPVTSHLSFGIGRSALSTGILIPKYYDPDIRTAKSLAEEAGFELPLVGDILEKGASGSRLGDWVRREHYGTGEIPYVRTSDLSNWRIRPEFKKGVSVVLYDELKRKQDIQEGDILFVAHGTYLIGIVAMVTEYDRMLVLQDHVFRLRVSSKSGIDPKLLLGALSTKFVHRQVRARQFSADIIDKIGNRHLGIRVPIPRDLRVQRRIVERVADVLEEQTSVRRDMEEVSRSNLRLTRERAYSMYQFSVNRKQLIGRILIPKYYDPDLDQDLRQAEHTYGEAWVTLRDLVDGGNLLTATGQEVGKMAYGTGDIPFLRTSDLAEWEVKRNVKQGVSDRIYARYRETASVAANDILLVRDGTYLVGSTALVTESDVPALFCGGMYRLRMRNAPEYAAYALLGFLNLPIVRRQMRARQFTRDVIDTLGHRLFEVRVPSPFSALGSRVGGIVGDIFCRKTAVKKEIDSIVDMLEPPSPPLASGRPGWSMR